MDWLIAIGLAVSPGVIFGVGVVLGYRLSQEMNQ